MGIVDMIKSRGAEAVGKAMEKLFEDPKRAEQVAELVGAIQRGRKTIGDAQEAAFQALGVVSRGEVQAAGKRLAALRKTARKLDDRLGQLETRLLDKP